MCELQFSPGCPKPCLRALGILRGQPRFRFPDRHFRRLHLELVAGRINPDDRLVCRNRPAVGEFRSNPDHAPRYFGTYSHLVVCPDCAGQFYRQRLLGPRRQDYIDDRFAFVRNLTGCHVKLDTARRPGKVQGYYNHKEYQAQLHVAKPFGPDRTIFSVVCLLHVYVPTEYRTELF